MIRASLCRAISKWWCRTCCSRIAYLAAKILVYNMSPIQYFKGQDTKGLNIEDPGGTFEQIKKQPDVSSFYYWYQTVQLLTEKTSPQIDIEDDINN